MASRRWWYDSPRPGLVTLNRWANRLAHRILANSGEVAKLLAREEGVPKTKIAELPNFLEERAFELVDLTTRIVQRRAWGFRMKRSPSELLRGWHRSRTTHLF